MENTKITSTAILNSFTRLCIKRTISTSENNKLSTKIENLELNLEEIDASKLRFYKASKKPGFVVKAGSSYFYTELPKHLQEEDFKAIATAVNIVLFTEHCEYCSNSNSTTNSNNRCTNCPILRASTSSKKKIEYDFITLGFEGFNISDNFLRILICEKHATTLQLHNVS